jgi:hypothetical protein
MDAEEERGSDVPAPRRAADLRPHEIETLAMVRARFSLQD